MDREAIVSAVQDETLIDNAEVTTICQNNIDYVQDNEICSNPFGHDFSFLVDYGYINTTPVYDTGTVDLTQDSTTVTGSGTTFTSAMAGRLFKVDGSDEYYEIASFTSATVIELTKAYIGSTATGQSYDIYDMYYPLSSDFLKMKWIKQIQSPTRLIDIPELTMAEQIPAEFDEGGNINGFVFSGIDSDGYQLVRFTPIPTTRKRAYYCYVKSLPSINSTGAESTIPSKWHMLFVYKLSEIVLLMNDKASKAGIYSNKFDKGLRAFIREDKSKSKDRINVMADESLLPKTNRVHLPYDQFPRLH